MARTPEIRTQLGRVLADRGITARELADRTGIGYTHLWRVIAGERPLTEEVAERVARAIGVKAESISTVPAKAGRSG